MSGVDVLAYFDDLIRNGDEVYESAAREARSAVAELIAADDECKEAFAAIDLRRYAHACLRRDDAFAACKAVQS